MKEKDTESKLRETSGDEVHETFSDFQVPRINRPIRGQFGGGKEINLFVSFIFWIFSAQNLTTLQPLSLSPGTPKAPVMTALTLSPFRSPRMYNLYPFPMLSRICPFLHYLLHWDRTPPPNKLIQLIDLIKEFNPENSRANTPKVYYCTMPHHSTGWPPLSIALPISWSPAVIPFTLHNDTYPSPFNFLSVKASTLNFPSLKTPTTSSLFTVPFIPLTFHVPNRFTKFCWVIQGWSQRHLPLRPRLDDALVGRRNRVRAPNPALQIIWLTPMTCMDYTLHLFCSWYKRNRIEGAKGL